MFIAILTLLSALSISGVAIFYSVIGLATIFPGAFVPVVIMGGVLEVGKLITASWLYRNWKFTPFMLKTYLTTAVIILSLITSMGIFGFLSKAHLEQNLASDTLIQRISILKDKIESEKMSITRQNSIIERAEKSINRDTGTASGDIGVQQSIIADANEKLKTLLTVETNTVRDLNGRLNTTVKDLNDRLKTLDKNVSDVLTSNKSFFNEEKAAADLKASQKAERKEIANKIAEAQETIAIKIVEAEKRIAELKADHKVEIAKAQEIIANMRSGSQDNKGQFNKEIENAEQKIFESQGKIDLYIVEKQPLEKDMLTLEAEIGPVKYIAALAVDWGITDQVETSKAVRWVILLLIVVFDPLAVLLLIAANQSLMRRFPPEPPKPQEIVDLEKPDEEDVTLKWNAMMDKSDAATKMEEATEQLKEWKDKLDSFNEKVEKPEEKPVEIIQEEQADTIPHIDLNGQKKTEDKVIVADYTDGFDPDEVAYDINPDIEEAERIKTQQDQEWTEFKKSNIENRENRELAVKSALEMAEEIEAIEQIERDARRDAREEEINASDEAKRIRVQQNQEWNKFSKSTIEKFKKREAEELEALKQVAREAREEEITATVEEALKMSEAESVETPIQEERIKPDLTEVIEPEAEIEKSKDVVKNSKPRVMRTIRPTEDRPPKPILSNWQRAELLDNFHKEHGNFEDVQDYVQNEEQGDTTTWKKIKNKTTTEEDYHLRMEQRIEDLMAKVEAGEIKLEDLTAEDRQVIMDIRNQNEV